MDRFRSLARPLSSGLVIATVASQSALADSPALGQIQTFIHSVIGVLVTLAGLLAAGFLVVGGIGYITSSGHPIRLERAKRTIMYSGLGLVITIGAYVISNVITELATSAFGK